MMKNSTCKISSRFISPDHRAAGISVLMLILSGCHCVESKKAPVPKSKPAVIVGQVQGEIVVDGELVEADWATAQWVMLDGHWPPVPESEDDQSQWRRLLNIKPPLELMAQRVEAASLWDGAGVYIGMRARDNDVQGNKTRHNDWLWAEDVLEVFLSGSDSPDSPHYEFQINPHGTTFFAASSNSSVTNSASKISPRYSAATSVQGTLNDSETLDYGYSAEWFFDWATLSTLGLTTLGGNAAETGPSTPTTLGYARFAAWDLTVYTTVRMSRYTTPGNFNPHHPPTYRPLVVLPEPR